MAVEIEALMLENFPGPWLIKILSISLIFILLFSKNLKSKTANLSKFSLLLINSLVYDLLSFMILKNILSLAASIIKLIILCFFTHNINAQENNSNYYPDENGIISIMYHRFDENKYPSTNIKIEIFKKQIELIKKNNIEFYNPSNFVQDFNLPKKNKKILLTIDDAFSSFYEKAWPYLKENKIPFILFVSTEPVGKIGYMNWKQIKEVEKENFAFIGNHSHSHEYLIEYDFNKFKNDTENSIKIFKNKIGYNPVFYSYPFGEYSLQQKNFIKKKFEFAFGQHSGVIDLNKDKYELPRFPINEKYGDLERFEFLIKLLPLQYKELQPEEKLISESNNPPKMFVKFFNEQKNLNKINCFSNEGNEWHKTDLIISNKKLIVNFNDKFLFRRGRINCSLNDNDGWRWFGTQFTIN